MKMDTGFRDALEALGAADGLVIDLLDELRLRGRVDYNHADYNAAIAKAIEAVENAHDELKLLVDEFNEWLYSLPQISLFGALGGELIQVILKFEAALSKLVYANINLLGASGLGAADAIDTIEAARKNIEAAMHFG
jgi:hypothetical protein